jgi:hypothetical protein
MTEARAWARVALVVGVALWVQGCATVEGGRGSWALERGAVGLGEGRPVRHGSVVSGEAQEAQAGVRRVEVEALLGQVWAVAREVEQEGAALDFRFWVEGGAVTPLGWQRTAEGGQRGEPVGEEAWARGVRQLLVQVTEQRTGALALRLQRERSGWRTEYEVLVVEEPPEVRPWPTRREGYAVETVAAVHGLAKQVVGLLQVPAGGSARTRVEVRLEDDRLKSWAPGLYEATGGGTVMPAGARAVEALSHALLPFTRGLGPRTVRLELVGRQEEAGAPSVWRVERAETLRPEPLAAEVEDAVKEYRELHASIFRQYREEMVDAVVLAGTFTLEEVALWVLGGMVGKGLHVLFRAVAPTVVRMMARGTEAVRWLRTLLVRAGPRDQLLLRRLWAKAETQGFEALTVAERTEFTALMGRLEKTLTHPLDRDTKELLRRHARKSFYTAHPPDLAKLLTNIRGERYDVHHGVPLEYAHLFPEVDINALINLNALADPVHGSIGKVWAAFGRNLGPEVKPAHVRETAELVDRHFSRWYNQFFDGSRASVEALSKAEQAALLEVDELVLRLRRHGR